MDDFAIPTLENRLVVHEDQLFQLAVDWARESRPARGSEAVPLARNAQRELKRIIAVMLVQDEDRDVVEGELLRVTLRKFDGSVVAGERARVSVSKCSRPVADERSLRHVRVYAQEEEAPRIAVCVPLQRAATAMKNTTPGRRAHQTALSVGRLCVLRACSVCAE